MAGDVDTTSTGDSAYSTTGDEDVKTTEDSAEETATTASGSDETSEDEKSEGKLADGTSEDKPVPYSQFREANEAKTVAERKAAELQRKLDELQRDKAGAQQSMQNLSPAQQAQVEAVKEQLKALGFVTHDEQQQTLRQQTEDLELKQEIADLSKKYDGSDGRPKFDKDAVLDYALQKKIGDLDSAYKLMNEKKLIDWQIRQVAGKTKGIKTEASTGTGKTTAGTTDQDLKVAAAKGDKDALHTFLKRRAAFAQKK
jgi:hypothetical protein